MKKSAFTLVELIVVITILAILATVAFISFQWYTQNSRDTVRISDVKNIEKWLWVYFAKNDIYPQPDDAVNITNGATTLNLQWYAGKSVLNTIGLFSWWVDPVTWDYYTYTTNSNFTKYQLLKFIENAQNISSLFPATFADLTDMTPVVSGDKLWTLINTTTNEPIQKSWSGIDITSSSNQYDVYVDQQTVVESDNTSALYSLLPNANCHRIKYFHPESKNGIYTINPNGTSYDKYCFMDYIGKSLVLHVTWDNNTAEDLTWNHEIKLNNFKVQSEISKVGRWLYGQHDESEQWTNIETEASYISYFDTNNVSDVSQSTQCEWTKSFNTSIALHGLVWYYYTQNDIMAFRFGDRVLSNVVTTWGSFEYHPERVYLLPSGINLTQEWNHICHVFDGQNYYLYFNGDLYNTIPASAENSWQQFTRWRFSLFYWSDIYNSTRYSVDEIMVFNQALWADEIKNIYDNQN